MPLVDEHGHLLRTSEEDDEVTRLLREHDRIAARLGELGIDLSIVRPHEAQAGGDRP